MPYVIFLSAIIAIVFGILILIWPQILNYLIGIWLIVYGFLELAIRSGY